MTNWSIDSRLIAEAEKQESAMIVKGVTPTGLPVMVIVVVGANVGLLSEKIADILPGVNNFPK